MNDCKNEGERRMEHDCCDALRDDTRMAAAVHRVRDACTDTIIKNRWRTWVCGGYEIIAKSNLLKVCAQTVHRG